MISDISYLVLKSNRNTKTSIFVLSKSKERIYGNYYGKVDISCLVEK